MDSWGGQWFSVGVGGVSSANLPFSVDPASPWPESYGNPSQSMFGVPGCPCLVQSTDNTTSPLTSSSQNQTNNHGAQVMTEKPATAEAPVTPLISAPTDCPICNLTSPSCLPPSAGN